MKNVKCVQEKSLIFERFFTHVIASMKARSENGRCDSRIYTVNIFRNLFYQQNRLYYYA